VYSICLEFLEVNQGQLRRLYDSMLAHLMLLWQNHTLKADQVYHVQCKMKQLLRSEG
jgi:hypothetical protein